MRLADEVSHLIRVNELIIESERRLSACRSYLNQCDCRSREGRLRADSLAAMERALKALYGLREVLLDSIARLEQGH